MKNQFNTQKKHWTTPSLKGQLLIKGTLGANTNTTNDAMAATATGGKS